MTTTTKTPPLAAFGFFDSRSSISLDRIRAQPMDEAIRKMEKCAEELNESVKKEADDDDESFGEKLKKAVKRKLHARGFSAAVTSDGGDESFGEKLKKAVERKLGKKEREERDKRERERYPGYKRKHSKGE